MSDFDEKGLYIYGDDNENKNKWATMNIKMKENKESQPFWIYYLNKNAFFSAHIILLDLKLYEKALLIKLAPTTIKTYCIQIQTIT